jgi:hypothetical protein
MTDVRTPWAHYWEDIIEELDARRKNGLETAQPRSLWLLGWPFTGFIRIMATQ